MGSGPCFGLEEAYAVDGPEASRTLYREWADTYESEFLAPRGYVYHHQVAEMYVARQVSGPVLDVGCGTGVVGQELDRLGVGPIDGLDLSPEMLAKARAKTGDQGPVYRSLFEADLTGPLDFPDGGYRGIVSAGTFTHGHVGPEALPELLRLAQAGAVCVLGINSAHFAQRGFADRLDRFIDDGAIHKLELVERKIYADSDRTDPDQIALLAAFTVL